MLGDATLQPVLLGLVAAALFGAQAVLARLSLRTLDAQSGALVTICTAALLFWAIYAWQADAAHWRSPGIWVFLSNGLLHPMLSMLLSFEANRRMGATVSATISATTPLIATAGAVLLLGEHVTLEIALGTLGIVFGIVVLSWSRSGTRDWGLLALLFPIGASCVRAFNFVWGKFGLSLLPAPVLAAALSYTVSGMLSVLAYRVRQGRLPLGLPPSGLGWAALSGLSVTGAMIALYSALVAGQVVVVSPLTNSYPIFALGLSLLFRQERPSRRIALGVVLVVGGVTLIGLR